MTTKRQPRSESLSDDALVHTLADLGRRIDELRSEIFTRTQLAMSYTDVQIADLRQRIESLALPMGKDQ